MTALNEWTAELKKNETHAWLPNSGRAERRQAFSHFDSTAMRVHTAETLSGRVVGLPDRKISRHLLLFDDRTGMLIEEWNEEMAEALPWAKDLTVICG